MKINNNINIGRCESIESKIFKIINYLSRGTLFGDVVARIIYRTRAINQEVTPNKHPGQVIPASDKK